MNFCFGERRLISLPTGYGKSLFLYLFHRLRKLLGDFISIVHFSPLTVGTSPKFSVRGLQSEFYRSASTCFKERTVRFFTQ